MKNNLYLLLLLALLPAVGLRAQISKNPDKFLGNITTSYQIDYGAEPFYAMWNQITPENETKWDQVEGSARGSYNWNNTSRIYNYAKNHGMPMKWHTLVWGSQYPRWMDNLSKTEQLKAVREWMDAIKRHYPDLPLIDVVNEAIPGHAPAPYKEALGGDGESGYDWIVTAFEMAHERWPDAILIYNDYNTFQWNTDQFIDLVTRVRDAGAPIDAYGCQSHDLTGCSLSTFKSSMARLQNALKMPMYITEYDIDTADDAYQEQLFKEQVPVMWEADYCAGVTLWGYIHGHTWVANSGLIKNGVERPALTWLRQYMGTEKALTAKSPFPGMVKEASVYVKPQSPRLPTGQSATIEVRATMRTKTIEKVELYVNSQLQPVMTEAPYVAEYTPKAKGKHALKAVVTTTDGSRYERVGSFTAYEDIGDVKFTDLAQLRNGQPFAIVSESEGKAFFCSDNQNLQFGDYNLAFSDNVVGYYYKLEPLTGNSDASIRNYYMLRQLTTGEAEYSIWGSPGYLNSQTADQWCCFILGLNNQNGQDIKNGAVWDVKYVDGKGFSLRNIGTGKYLHDASPAKYDEPAYFTFCTRGAATGIDTPAAKVAEGQTPTGVYTLQGVRLGSAEVWGSLKPGLYIVDGKKTLKR